MSSNPSDEQLKQAGINNPNPVGPPQPGIGAQQTTPSAPQAAPPPGPGVGKARLQCHACNRLLEYDAGAQYVQCFSCTTMNAVQPGTQIGGRVLSMLCAICHTTNLAPYGINYVRCGTCSTISQVTHAYNRQPQPGQHSGQEQQAQSQSQPTQQQAAEFVQQPQVYEEPPQAQEENVNIASQI
ncbi:uncharacterized protein LOC129616337 [Condylostylus longicornis]|uniref:uncharacterized protein LOC129616337 n=1 Tax=Condylostylus longicornis TaxID=2530218 RepID=UPI00244DDE61|nr:uncharacterized protein LOC129616337 [Condylostylus longicornis]